MSVIPSRFPSVTEQVGRDLRAIQSCDAETISCRSESTPRLGWRGDLCVAASLVDSVYRTLSREEIEGYEGNCSNNPFL
jgi:hypothetical protein